MVRLHRRSLVDQRCDLLRVDPADPDGGLVRGVRGHGEHGTVTRIERDDRPAVRRPLAVLVRERDAVANRALRGSLETHVDRQLHGVSRLGAAPRLERAPWTAGRIDPDLRKPCPSTKELVRHRLDARLPDLVARSVPLAGQDLELAGRDLTDVPEQLCGDRLVVVVPQVRLHDLHAREVDLMLLQVGDLVFADGGLDGDRIDRVVPAGIDIRRELAHGYVENGCEPADFAVAPVLRQISDPQLDRGPGGVVDDHGSVPVEDRPAESLDPNQPELVVLRGGEVLGPREKLERPEPEEQDAEDQQRGRTQDADAHRQPRRQPVRLLRLRVGWQKPLRERAPATIRSPAARQATAPRPGAASTVDGGARHTAC